MALATTTPCRLAGQFHLILNPDVQLSEEAIPLAMDLLASERSVALLAPTGRRDNGEPEYLAKAYPSVWALDYARLHLLGSSAWVSVRGTLRDEISSTTGGAACYAGFRLLHMGS